MRGPCERNRDDRSITRIRNRGKSASVMCHNDTATSAINPCVMVPSVSCPSGISPSGMSPSGMIPSGMSPSHMRPSGMSSSRMSPSAIGSSIMRPTFEFVIVLFYRLLLANDLLPD